jgi:hypothetical protein
MEARGSPPGFFYLAYLAGKGQESISCPVEKLELWTNNTLAPSHINQKPLFIFTGQP